MKKCMNENGVSIQIKTQSEVARICHYGSLVAYLKALRCPKPLLPKLHQCCILYARPSQAHAVRKDIQFRKVDSLQEQRKLKNNVRSKKREKLEHKKRGQHYSKDFFAFYPFLGVKTHFRLVFNDITV